MALQHADDAQTERMRRRQHFRNGADVARMVGTVMDMRHLVHRHSCVHHQGYIDRAYAAMRDFEAAVAALKRAMKG